MQAVYVIPTPTGEGVGGVLALGAVIFVVFAIYFYIAAVGDSSITAVKMLNYYVLPVLLLATLAFVGWGSWGKCAVSLLLALSVMGYTAAAVGLTGDARGTLLGEHAGSRFNEAVPQAYQERLAHVQPQIEKLLATFGMPGLVLARRDEDLAAYIGLVAYGYQCNNMTAERYQNNGRSDMNELMQVAGVGQQNGDRGSYGCQPAQLAANFGPAAAAMLAGQASRRATQAYVPNESAKQAAALGQYLAGTPVRKGQR